MHRVKNIFDNKLKREIVPFLYPCFTPFVSDLINDNHNDSQFTNETLENELKSFAERNIKARSVTKPLLKREICDNITCGSTPANKPYISPALR